MNNLSVYRFSVQDTKKETRNLLVDLTGKPVQVTERCRVANLIYFRKFSSFLYSDVAISVLFDNILQRKWQCKRRRKWKRTLKNVHFKQELNNGA